MSLTIEPQAAPAAADILDDIAEACRRIPPLWDLANYVAVNPFLGFAQTPIESACETIAAGLGARVLPNVDFYRQARRDGRLGARSLERSAARCGLDARQIEAALESSSPTESANPAKPLRTVAEIYDEVHETRLASHVRNDVARWCAVYASDGGAQWGDVRQGSGLFATWLRAARVDRSLEVLGLRGYRGFMRQVPQNPQEAIAAMVDRLDVPVAQRAEYFYRLLGRMYGWACYFRRDEWQRGSDQPGAVGELLAILICSDAAVAALGPVSFEFTPPANAPMTTIQLALQNALEDEYVTKVLKSLATATTGQAVSRPSVQAAFCIDVRSEPLRRHLEAQSDSVQTIGFAGFFGVSLDWRSGSCGSARCPVLLKPSVAVASVSENGAQFPGAVEKIQAAPSSAFSYVETFGLAYGGRLAADALTLGGSEAAPDETSAFTFETQNGGVSLSQADQVNLAAGILKNMSLRGPLARLVMLCGHVGRSANNPHAAGLDCGACGGHGGAINARVAASILNQDFVRKELLQRGFVVPDDTHFLPAVHDTSTDDIRFLDTDVVPATHADDLKALRAWLDQAGALTRKERSRALGLDFDDDKQLKRSLERRSRDWSQVRPEWGLARNASFIAARRCRSRMVDLQGRTFLHDYDAALDVDGSVLSLILSAPMIVASWINLQYFASTVDNDVLGCGDKTLHNRIGFIGVVLGNGGDLRTGLPLQSVHAADGTFYHEPLRLQVIVEAPVDRIEAVLQAHKSVRDLVANEWARLFALDSSGRVSYRRLPAGGWETMTQ